MIASQHTRVASRDEQLLRLFIARNRIKLNDVRFLCHWDFCAGTARNFDSSSSTTKGARRRGKLFNFNLISINHSDRSEDNLWDLNVSSTSDERLLEIMRLCQFLYWHTWWMIWKGKLSRLTDDDDVTDISFIESLSSQLFYANRTSRCKSGKLNFLILQIIHSSHPWHKS